MIAKNKKIKKPGRFREVFFPALIAIFFLAIAGFLVFSNLKISQKRAELADRVEWLKEEIYLLEERNEQLKAGIIKTESDAYWESRLYEQGYKKPGEEAIVILLPERTENELVPEEKDFLENLLDWILDR